jgi:predicted nucleic acid-binding protein
MSDRVFVDTNILIYSISNEPPKRAIAEDVLLNQEVVISPQVIIEKTLIVYNPFIQGTK